MGQSGPNGAAMADDDHVLAGMLLGQPVQRPAEAGDHLDQAFSAGGAFIGAQRPEGMGAEFQFRRQVGMGQALPFPQLLLDHVRLYFQRHHRMAGGEDRFGGAAGA